MSLDFSPSLGVAPGVLPPMTRESYRWARQLEAYSFSTTPEGLAVTEGLRAALVIAGLVGIAAWLGRPILGWAAFGAFWTCLVDPGGPTLRRFRAMAGFALAGGVGAFAASFAGHFGALAGGAALACAALILGLSGALGQAAGTAGMVATVVAGVAVAFPRPALGAVTISATFLLGSITALLVCLVLWKTHPHAPARRALAAVYVRLADMLSQVLALDAAGAPPASWSRDTAASRRAARSAIERSRGLVLDLEGSGHRYRGELDTIETVFAALVAVGHEAAHGDRRLLPSERDALRRLLGLLAETRAQTILRTPRPAALAAEAEALAGAMPGNGATIERAVAAAARALMAQAAAWPHGARPAAPLGQHGTTRTWPLPSTILRHACRLAIAVSAAYAIAAAIGLSFSYWTTMATIFVVQPLAVKTWPRGIERMLGSTIGGCLAALLLTVLPQNLLLLPLVFLVATGAIALRRVNYTLHVLFVTALFVLVTELLFPTPGIPSARIIDNLVGSIIGTAAVLLLWPERMSADPAARLADAIRANATFAAEVVATTSAAARTAASGAAGIASTEAEVALHRLGLAGLGRRWHRAEAAALLASLRELAGAAAAYALAGHDPEPGRADELRKMGDTIAAALRGSGPARAPCPPRDAIDAAFARVAAAAAGWGAATRAAKSATQ